jgi:hypothetical protein
MKTFHALAIWPLRAKLLTVAALSALVVAGVLLATPDTFFFVLALGIAFSAVCGYWLGARWFLVPLVAMVVEIAIAVPLTLFNPSGGETPISVVLEAPFWTGVPALVGALIGSVTRFVVEQHKRKPAQAAG